MTAVATMAAQAPRTRPAYKRILLKISGEALMGPQAYGLHPPTARDGTVDLTAGPHALRIDHFERDGGQQITLQWKPPGAADFTLVPNSALSTDAGVVRVTAPGRKECETAGDSPGRGMRLATKVR